MEDAEIQLAVDPAPLAPPSAAEEVAAAAEAGAAAAEVAVTAERAADPAMITCLNWTPLHVAASRGRLEQSHIALLKENPALAEAPDSLQRSLLHLASANGRLETVKELIKVTPEMCLARDGKGANPIHVAAMRGKVDVLDELYQANPHAARARVDTGESILHLCVKYNQPEFLKMLLENYFKGDREFVNAKDNAGNTILHLAVAGRRPKIVENVLSHTEINLHATNASNQTARDILLLRKKRVSRLEEVDIHIESLLGHHIATTTVKYPLIDTTELAEKRNGIMVAAALIATLAFQAAVAPPGGVWQDDKDGHKSGKSVMAFNNPGLYWYFVLLNGLSFVSSLFTVYSMIIMRNVQSRMASFAVLVTLFSMGLTIISVTGTYVISLLTVTSNWREFFCAGRGHLPPGCPVTHSDYKKWIARSIVVCVAAALLTGIGVLISRIRNIRKYEEIVNGHANPAPVGEANA